MCSTNVKSMVNPYPVFSYVIIFSYLLLCNSRDFWSAVSSILYISQTRRWKMSKKHTVAVPEIQLRPTVLPSCMQFSVSIFDYRGNELTRPGWGKKLSNSCDSITWQVYFFHSLEAGFLSHASCVLPSAGSKRLFFEEKHELCTSGGQLSISQVKQCK